MDNKDNFLDVSAALPLLSRAPEFLLRLLTRIEIPLPRDRGGMSIQPAQKIPDDELFSNKRYQRV